MAERGRESIEQEMDEVRARLGTTIDQLVHRSSPKTIAKRQVGVVRAYFVDEAGQPRTDHIVKVAGGVVGTIVVLGVIRKIVG